MLALIVAISSAAASCGSTAKYSDELLTTVATLIRGTADDATRYLDDRCRNGVVVTGLEAATITWGARLTRIADDIQRHFTLPDEQKAARAFEEGTARATHLPPRIPRSAPLAMTRCRRSSRSPG